MYPKMAPTKNPGMDLVVELVVPLIVVLVVDLVVPLIVVLVVELVVPLIVVLEHVSYISVVFVPLGQIS